MILPNYATIYEETKDYVVIVFEDEYIPTLRTAQELHDCGYAIVQPFSAYSHKDGQICRKI